jgi:mannose-1-phosphate guanylyltransferase
MIKRCFSVIIAGGKGTRFWPLSRARRPKQLLKITGTRKSLIEESAERVYPLSGRKQTLVVTVADQVRGVKRVLADLPKTNFIIEPKGKNTAPCIGLAALEVTRRDPEAVMIVLPADHWVNDGAGFRRTLRAAVALAARHDRLVTIGIRPTYPETGYGYIMKDKALGAAGSFKTFSVNRFSEKPTLAVAERLIRLGALWNSGIFVWRAATLLALLARYQPGMFRSLDAIRRAAGTKSLADPGPKLSAAIARAYRTMPNLSIDYAVMEKAGSEGKVLTVKAEFGWSDVGSWAAVHRLLAKDPNGNAGRGRWLGRGAKDCLIYAADRLVVLLGIENAFIVDTPDALLIGDLKRSQEVRDLVDELNRRRLRDYTM